ncbi:MAG: hypothetical protein JWO58_161 [Chitinophagaceae bacterium]|nr:hypothetical protein [Chitinophagaceae bacterium]
MDLSTIFKSKNKYYRLEEDMLNKIYFFTPWHAFRIVLILLAFLYSHLSQGQGCSDAGFCTMGAMRPNQRYSTQTNIKLRSVEFSQYLGYTKFDDLIINYTLDANVSIGDKNTLQIKLPYQFVRGSLANTHGTGDVSLSFTRNLVAKSNYQINGSIGTKIPTMVPNLKTDDGRPLPSYYQTSLGTYDAIAGISLITRRWLFATGYQQALNTAHNEFAWAAWVGSDKEQTARAYPVSKDLLRGKDIMLRVERNFRSSKFNAYLGLLGIYRITKDKVFDPTTKSIQPKDGSTGLALTALGGVGYNISVKTTIKGMFGYKLVARDINPDGLSREWVQTIGVEYKF